MSELTSPSTQGLAAEACHDPQPNTTGTGRRNLQRRVQNALSWRSWGGECDTAGPNHQGSGPASKPAAKTRGRSVGSDVELSSISSSTSTALNTPSMSGALGYPLIDSMHGAADGKSIGSYKSSTSSAAGGPLNDNSSTVHRSESQAGSIAANDDLCSVATQAGSTAHSFTSLHSMMTDQGDGAPDAGYAAAGTNIGSAAGSTMSQTGASSLVSSFRGSDAGADGANSVSTLPLISEAAYDDEQLLEDSEEVRSLGDVVVGSRALGGFEEQDAAYEDNPLQASLKPRVSSSHGSMTSFTSEASSSLPGGSATARIPSSGFGSSGRSLYSSQRSSSGTGRLSYQQQQGLASQGLASLQQQQQDGHEGRSSIDLPLPFSSRKRPDNDEVCSLATQAGSVHSVSSVMSSAFMENNAPLQRQLYSSGGGASADGNAAAGQQQQLQYVIHPLSEPAADGLEAGDPAEGSEVDDEAGFGSSVAQQGTARNSSGSSSPVSSHSQQQGGAADPAATAAGHQQQQQHSGLERKGSLKGALRSVVAWGSGLGQRLHRAGSSSLQLQHSSKQQHGAQQGSKGSKGSAAASSGDKGQPQAGAGASAGSQELASL